MKKVLFTFYAIMLCSICLKAANGEFKFNNMYYISTSDSTAKLSRGYLVGDIVIPDTVKYIGKLAFAAADGLVKVSGGKNVI